MAESEFQRPTLAENISMIRTDLFARLDINDELRRMDEDVRAKVYAGALHTVYGYIDYLAMNMLPDLCDESWLYRHAAMKRCPRKDAVAASGFMRWDGVKNELKVSAGSVIQRDDLVQYIVQADATSAGGVLRVRQRQQRLDAKVNFTGGINEDFYLRQLAALGKPGATITRYNKGPFKCTSSCMDATYSTEWRYYWQVNMPASTDATWMTCSDNCETPIRYWGDTVAECVINKLCPSYTYVIFKYP